MNKVTHVYKFRAETNFDVGVLSGIIIAVSSVEIDWYFEPNTEDDPVVSFTAPFTFEEMQAFMSHVPDGHVMYQTLAYLSEYTGERNYKLHIGPTPLL